MMNCTVSEVIIRYLEKEGVEYAFGISGTHLLSFIHALKNSKIKYISVKHEGAAGFMALQYAKVAQKPALLLATSGPGAAHLINGIAEMYKSGIPVFVMTPLVSRKSIGRIAVQEDSGYASSYSIISIMQNITRKSILAIMPDMIAVYMQELMRYALSSPYGPVHLGVPSDLFESEIEYTPLEPYQYRLVNDERVEIRKIQKAVTLLAEAKKPIILIGLRCIFPDCSAELQKLVSTFNIPFIATQHAKGLLHERQPYFGGILDFTGHRSAEKLVRDCDFVLSVGMDFSESATIRYDPDFFKAATLVSCDSNTSIQGINYPINLGISGNLPAILDTIHERLTTCNYRSPWNEMQFKNLFNEWNAQQQKDVTDSKNTRTTKAFLFRLSQLLNDDSYMLFSDIGAAGFSAIRHYEARAHGFYINESGASMGQAVAGCIGGKLAAPEKQVVCITGDGSFLMYLGEVLTACHYRLGITWIIFKNDTYNFIDINQNIAYNGELDFCTKFTNPDFKILAAAVSAEFCEASTIHDLESCVQHSKRCHEKKKNCFLVVNADQDNPVPIKPRIIEFMKDYGQVKHIKDNPYLMKIFNSVLKEKV